MELAEDVLHNSEFLPEEAEEEFKQVSLEFGHLQNLNRKISEMRAFLVRKEVVKPKTISEYNAHFNKSEWPKEWIDFKKEYSAFQDFYFDDKDD